MRGPGTRASIATAILLVIVGVVVVVGVVFARRPPAEEVTRVTSEQVTSPSLVPGPTGVVEPTTSPTLTCTSASAPKNASLPATQLPTVQVGPSTLAADGTTHYSISVQEGELSTEQLAQALGSACGVTATTE